MKQIFLDNTQSIIFLNDDLIAEIDWVPETEYLYKSLNLTITKKNSDILLNYDNNYEVQLFLTNLPDWWIQVEQTTYIKCHIQLLNLDEIKEFDIVKQYNQQEIADIIFQINDLVNSSYTKLIINISFYAELNEYIFPVSLTLDEAESFLLIYNILEFQNILKEKIYNISIFNAAIADIQIQIQNESIILKSKTLYTFPMNYYIKKMNLLSTIPPYLIINYLE